MEVKPGYKQTEVGVIPEEWEVSIIGHLCAAVLDCHHSTPVWTASGSIVIRNQNIRDGKLDLSQPSFTDETNFAERTRRAVPSFGDLVITREAPMGLVCMIPKGLKCCLGQRMVLLRPNHDTADTQYLLYALLSEAFQRSIAVAGGTGSTVSNLRIPVLKGLEIPAPPLPEQRAIAEALSDVDGLLGGLDRLIAKKRDLKQAAMQQLLTGQTRLPGFHGEWEVKRLGAICKLINGRGFKPHEWSDVGLPIIRIQNLNGSEDFNCYSGLYDPKLEVEHGQLLFAWSGSRGTSFGPHIWNGGRALLNYHTWKVVVNPAQIQPAYFFHALRQLTIAIEDQAHGASALVHTQKGEMERQSLPVPSNEEQTAIATVLSEMDGELAVLEQRREKTRALKQAMMQELLTGRTRLI